MMQNIKNILLTLATVSLFFIQANTPTALAQSAVNCRIGSYEGEVPAVETITNIDEDTWRINPEPINFTTSVVLHIESDDPAVIENARLNYTVYSDIRNSLVLLSSPSGTHSAEHATVISPQDRKDWIAIKFTFEMYGLPPDFTLQIKDIDGRLCNGAENNKPLWTTTIIDGRNPGVTPVPGSNNPTPSTPPKDECADAQDKSYCRAKIACENNQNPDRCVSQKVCEELKSEGYVYTAAFEGGSAFEETKSNDASFNAYGGCFNLTDFIGTTVNYLLMFGTIIAGFMFAYASFKYLTSRGNPSELADARDMIMQTVIGLILIALAMVIVNFLTSAFGSVTPDINLMPFGG